MSNHLAVATVTATLRRSLQSALDVDVPGAKVSNLRPDRPPTPPGVNLYLYQVTPNPALRNNDVPTRWATGELGRRPVAALDLHYLLSFHGDEGSLEPQRVMASVVRSLHAAPTLTHKMIQDTLADPTFNFLARSDLAESLQLVRFTPAPLSLDEMSKLWSVFFQTRYTLSIAYIGAAVLVDADVTPQAALPVQQPLVAVLPFQQPHITHVLSQSAPDQPVREQPILAGYRLVLRGEQLRGAATRVRVSGRELTPVSIAERQITVDLPPDLTPGLQSVQVLQPALLGSPAVAHRGFESNVAAFVLRPTVTATASGGNVSVHVTPPVGRTQRVVLLLDELTPPADRTARAYAFTAPERRPTDPDTTADLTIPAPGTATGAYLVRLQVDGAESPVSVDPATGRYSNPRVSV